MPGTVTAVIKVLHIDLDDNEYLDYVLDSKKSKETEQDKDLGVLLYLLHLYPGFYSYTEGATWKIPDLLMETLLI